LLAGQAFEEAMAICEEHPDVFVSSKDMQKSAYEAYEKIDPGKAINILEDMIRSQIKEGAVRQASDNKQKIAVIYLEKLKDNKKAIEAFEEAGDWYAESKSA
jgi:alpha-soluble NSF attachment protein